jgi:AAA family ATP:ADP antiporter
MLFSRVDTETKYKAKNAIDVPVYRGGDALIAQVDSALSGAGMSAPTLALIGAGAAAAWAVNGYVLGRSKGQMDAEDAARPEAVAAR